MPPTESAPETETETEAVARDDSPETLEQLVEARRRAELMLAASWLLTSIDADDFVLMLDRLVVCVRREEIALMNARKLTLCPPAPPAAPEPGRRHRNMDPADAERIYARGQDEPRTPTGKFPQGFAGRLAAEFGYSKGQVQKALQGGSAA